MPSNQSIHNQSGHPLIEALVVGVSQQLALSDDTVDKTVSDSPDSVVINESLNNLNEPAQFHDNIDGEVIIAEYDADGFNPGSTDAGVPFPGEILAETGFFLRFSNRFHNMLRQNKPKFQSFESAFEDLTTSIKESLILSPLQDSSITQYKKSAGLSTPTCGNPWG